MTPQSVSMVWRISSIAVIALALAWGAWIQDAVLLGSDVGWLIRSVRLMSEGQRFGVEIFEANLPVTWYLCRPAAWAIDAFGISEVAAIRLWIWTVAGVSLLVARACILHAGDSSPRTLVELAAAAVAACILVGPSFGQREHLAFLLSLPYLFAVKLQSSETPTVSGYAIAAGVLAGIAFSIKPIFLAIPLTVEFAHFAVQGRQWRLIRPVTIAIAIAGLVSAGGTLMLAPEYLRQVVPLTYATYWAYDSGLGKMLELYPVAMIVFVGWLAALFADPRIAHGSLVWFAAFVGWTVSYFFQHRGFDYHGFPALACAFTLSAGAFAVLAGRLREVTAPLREGGHIEPMRLKILVGAAMLLVGIVTIGSDTRLWFRSSQEGWQIVRATVRREVVAYLESLGIGRGQSVFAFSTDPFPAFPSLNYLGADWVGPDMAQFMLPAWLRRDEAKDAAHRVAIEAAMAVQREHVHRALVEGDPDVILVNRWSHGTSPYGVTLKRIDYFAIFGTDPAIAAALDRYRKIGEVGGTEVYVRRVSD
jgi:hypothetical protein